jgi:hypothetical protein
MELKGQGLHFRICFPWASGQPLPIFWMKLNGVIPSRIGMRMIAGMTIKNLFRLTTENLFDLNLPYFTANLMPRFIDFLVKGKTSGI